MTRNFALLFSILLMAQAASASTVLVASDNFQADALGTIKNVGGGSGWASNWASAQTAPNGPQVVDPAADLQGNRALQFTTNDNNAASRTLSAVQSRDVVVDFLFQYSGVLGRNDFLAIWFDNFEGPNVGLKANCDKPSGCANDLFARTNANGGAIDMSNSDLIAGQTYHVMGHLYKSSAAGSYDRFDTWIDPTAAEIASLTGWDARATGLSGITSFNTIGFRTANLDNNVTVRVDDLNIRNIPEPASMALMGLALAGMGCVRRRRAK